VGNVNPRFKEGVRDRRQQGITAKQHSNSSGKEQGKKKRATFPIRTKRQSSDGGHQPYSKRIKIKKEQKAFMRRAESREKNLTPTR